VGGNNGNTVQAPRAGCEPEKGGKARGGTSWVSLIKRSEKGRNISKGKSVKAQKMALETEKGTPKQKGRIQCPPGREEAGSDQRTSKMGNGPWPMKPRGRQ